MKLYSVIILFKDSPECDKISYLQSMCARNFLKSPVITLPPHFTLLKWSSITEPSIGLFDLLSKQNCRLHCNLKTIEYSQDKKSIWWHINESYIINGILLEIFNFLVNDGIEKKDIFLYNRFHVTLAYKEYSELEIVEIYQSFSKLDIGDINIDTDRIAICEYIDNETWAIKYEIT